MSMAGALSCVKLGGRGDPSAAGSQFRKYLGVSGGSRGVVSRLAPIYFQQTNTKPEVPATLIATTDRSGGVSVALGSGRRSDCDFLPAGVPLRSEFGDH